MTNLETYIQQAESQGSKHCLVPTETLRALLDVAVESRLFISKSSELVNARFNGSMVPLELAFLKLEEARR